VNIRNLAIISAVVVVIISLVAFIFFQTLIKESAPVHAEPSVKAVITKDKDAEASYAIPEGIPPVAVIEESMKKNHETVKQIKQDLTQMDANNSKIRQEIRVQMEITDKAAIASPQQVSIAAAPAVAKPERFSSEQQAAQKQQVKARGLLAF